MNCKTKRRCSSIFVLVSMLGIAPITHAQPPSDKTSLEDVRKETHDFMQTLESYTADQRDEAIRKTKAALDDLDERIDALQAHINRDWNKMDKATREKARAGLKALREERARADQWYGKLKSSSVEAWGHMKKGFSDAYGSLYDAWEKSEKEFGSEK